MKMEIPFPEVSEFRRLVYAAYKKEGRSFPWRENTGAWGVLVSELMLQQTQTERVIPYWKRWMEKWPCPAALADASLEDALREWSGLGYNRRAKNLRDCAGIIAGDFHGKVPDTPEVLEQLPGIGPYTAGAVACFAYNYPSVFAETNIRSVIIHFYFKEKDKIHDREIKTVLEKTLDRENPRTWYWALMDYGAALKKAGLNPDRKSARYNRQSAFKGSFRQIRGSIMRAIISGGPATADEIRVRMDVPAEEQDFSRALDVLGREMLVTEKSGIYTIPG